MKLHDRYLRRLYRGGRPNRVAKALNRVGAVAFARGIWPNRAAALEVRGRSSGRTISFPVVIADFEGERYLVSMLGAQANWVLNVRADDGHATLRHGRREQVLLEEVPVASRAPILQRYLAVAPGARPHVPVDRHASLAEFERIAPDYPVFRLTPRKDAAAGEPTRPRP